MSINTLLKVNRKPHRVTFISIFLLTSNNDMHQPATCAVAAIVLRGLEYSKTSSYWSLKLTLQLI